MFSGGREKGALGTNGLTVPLLVYSEGNVSSGWEYYNIIKKETLAQVFCCNFCGIFKNKFFREYLRTTATILILINFKTH